jgi:hypothetical protein
VTSLDTTGVYVIPVKAKEAHPKTSKPKLGMVKKVRLVPRNPEWNIEDKNRGVINMRRTGGVIAISLLILTTTAYSQQEKSTSYNCVDEFAGGIAYNYVTKRWAGTSFRVDGRARFILKVTYIGRHKDKVLNDTDVDDYNVTISRSGRDTPKDCWNNENSYSVEMFATSDSFKCSVGLTEYVFGTKTHRFLRIYTSGYVDGKDNIDDAPSIAGGTCIEM